MRLKLKDIKEKVLYIVKTNMVTRVLCSATEIP